MMSESGSKTYRPWDPERYQHEAQSPAAKLPAGDLVFFLLDTVRRLDLRRFYAPYEQETRGAPPFDPAMMVCLLLYAYCVGVFSSRKIALACERNLAFLAIVGQERPDFRTISDFRKLHLEAFKDVLVHVVRLAGAMGLVRLGNVATDGTKMQGNASRHKAMSYGYMQKAVERLREEIEALVTQAYQQDAAEEAALGSRRGDELPTELARREERLGQIEAAMRRLEARAKVEAHIERQRRAAAEAERARTGTPRRGKAPQPVVETPDAKAQSNFTDPELHIMRTNNKGWDYCGNAQASVDATCQIIVACDVTDASNDKQQAEPMAQATLSILAQAGIARPQSEAGEAQAIPATLDNGYYSEAAAQALEDLGFEPYMATGRQKHHAPEAEASDAPATAQERMAAKVRAPDGKALYARRKVIVEPVCGQSKEVRGFRRFLLRGLAKIRGEWRLVCLTHNLLKVWRYGSAPRAA
ncbi:MAG TPA: transposase [Candidatus Saccharimonadia bacterium]|nr:transposase [Candidatus Saccharimonadia bacterium]